MLCLVSQGLDLDSGFHLRKSWWSWCWLQETIISSMNFNLEISMASIYTVFGLVLISILVLIFNIIVLMLVVSWWTERMCNIELVVDSVFARLRHRVRSRLVRQHRTAERSTDDTISWAAYQLTERECKRHRSHSQPCWNADVRWHGNNALPAEYISYTYRNTSGDQCTIQRRNNEYSWCNQVQYATWVFTCTPWVKKVPP